MASSSARWFAPPPSELSGGIATDEGIDYALLGRCAYVGSMFEQHVRDGLFKYGFETELADPNTVFPTSDVLRELAERTDQPRNVLERKIKKLLKMSNPDGLDLETTLMQAKVSRNWLIHDLPSRLRHQSDTGLIGDLREEAADHLRRTAKGTWACIVIGFPKPMPGMEQSYPEFITNWALGE